MKLQSLFPKFLPLIADKSAGRCHIANRENEKKCPGVVPVSSDGRPAGWCNLCGLSGARAHLNLSGVVRCDGCGFIFLADIGGSSSRYGREYFRSSHPLEGGYEDYAADEQNIRRTFDLRWIWMEEAWSTPLPHSPCLLDVGCAFGYFLDTARARGWRAEGVDVSSHAVATATARGHKTRLGEISRLAYPAESFDLVSLWDVIEHGSNPTATLQECRRVLKGGGYIALSTPDAGCALAKILGRRWLGYRSLGEHVCFFDRATIRRALESAGFEILRVRSAGKYMSLNRAVTRLRHYSRIAARALSSLENRAPDLSIYLNPLDTMFVLARKKCSRSGSSSAPSGHLLPRGEGNTKEVLPLLLGESAGEGKS